MIVEFFDSGELELWRLERAWQELNETSSADRQRAAAAAAARWWLRA